MSSQRTHIAGVGSTDFGTHSDRSTRSLFGEAADAAMRDAEIEPAAIEEVFYGNFIGGQSENQGHQAPLNAERVGVSAPATRFENACASAGAALRHAVHAVRSGRIDVALVGGAERMSNMGTPDATMGLASAADALYELRAGMTFPGAYALMAEAYFREYGGSHEDLAHVAVKNHDNALPNDHAHLRTEITVEDVLSAPTVADPLGLYDCCPVSDGASALVLVSDAYAAEHDHECDVSVTGAGQASDRLALQDRESMARTPATTAAADEAYAQAGISAAAVDVAEVHDCFTIAEVLALEALGLVERGEGVTAARDGRTTRTGSLPVNLSGGLKAKGHPVGATGVGQVTELTRLLRGDHPRSDAIDGATTAVAHNAGGTVASATVHVLEVDA